MVGGRFHQETKTGILDFEVRLGSASSLLELCPRRKPGKQETALPGKGKRKGWCFPYGLFVLVVAVVFFCGGLGEASVIFCPWLQGMCWDLVKLWWKFSNVAMDHQSWSQKVCQEGLGLISRTAAWVKMMLSTIWWLWWGSFLTENSRAVFLAYNWGLG